MFRFHGNFFVLETFTVAGDDVAAITFKNPAFDLKEHPTTPTTMTGRDNAGAVHTDRVVIEMTASNGVTWSATGNTAEEFRTASALANGGTIEFVVRRSTLIDIKIQLFLNCFV